MPGTSKVIKTSFKKNDMIFLLIAKNAAAMSISLARQLIFSWVHPSPWIGAWFVEGHLMNKYLLEEELEKARTIRHDIGSLTRTTKMSLVI